MDYDSDDLNDYDDGDHYEEEYTDEDYQKFDELVPTVKTLLKEKYNNSSVSKIKTSEIEETLWNTYFVINDTIKSLQKSFNLKTKKASRTRSTSASPSHSPTQIAKEHTPSTPTTSSNNTYAHSTNTSGASTPEPLDLDSVDKVTATMKNFTLDGSRLPQLPKKSVNITEVIKERNDKPHVNFVVIGHVDHGKSTLMGRLLYDTGVIDEQTIRKLKHASTKSGKSSFFLAWVMDATEEERLRGITADISQKYFETDKTSFTILDAPGHRDFIPNMIGGAAQASLAVLVVDSTENALQSGLSGQTVEHAFLVRNMGIENLVVVVNKMDANNWSEASFESARASLIPLLTEVGYNDKKLQFIPCSGLTGGNVVNKSNDVKFNWYKGPTLLDCLSEYSDNNLKDINSPFIFPISDFNLRGNSISFGGSVQCGSVQVGETVAFSPCGRDFVVKSIEVDEKKRQVAAAGDSAYLTFSGINLTETDIQEGDIISGVNAKLSSVTKFRCKITTFQINRPLFVGNSIVVHRGSSVAPASISKIVGLLDEKGNIKRRRVAHLGSHQTAVIEIALNGRELPLQPFSDNKYIGRVILREKGNTFAAGIVDELL